MGKHCLQIVGTAKKQKKSNIKNKVTSTNKLALMGRCPGLVCAALSGHKIREEYKPGSVRFAFTSFQNKGRAEYVREKYVEMINRKTEDYRKFKELSDEWVELSIKLSRLEMED